MCGDGKTESRKVHAEANAWRAVEGVVADRRISKRLKGKVMSTFVTPACLHETETFGTDRNTTTKASSVRKQLGTKNSKSKEGRQELKGHCIEFKYYADGIHSGLTPPG